MIVRSLYEHIDHILIVKCIMTATCIQSHELYRFTLIRLFVAIQGALMADFYNSHIIHKIIHLCFFCIFCLILTIESYVFEIWFCNNSLDLDWLIKKRYLGSRISVAATLISRFYKSWVFFSIFVVESTGLYIVFFFGIW